MYPVKAICFLTGSRPLMRTSENSGLGSGACFSKRQETFQTLRRILKPKPVDEQHSSFIVSISKFNTILKL